MMYWVYWVKIVGQIRAILPDGRLDVEMERWIEWRPDVCAADGW